MVGAYYSGESDLKFLEWLGSTGTVTAVKTSLNSSSSDLCVTPDGNSSPARVKDYQHARSVVSALLKLGATPTLTCAPYFDSIAPSFGDNLSWAESNAVIYANSIIGARSLKTPQYLDLACAITGKAPLTGPLTDEGRNPDIVIDAGEVPRSWFRDGIGYELLGFWCGQHAQNSIPYLLGVPSGDETMLRSLCSGLGVTGNMAMTHIHELTPEWRSGYSHISTNSLLEDTICIKPTDLTSLKSQFYAERSCPVGTVTLGAPHASKTQINSLANIVRAKAQPFQTRVVISLSREMYDQNGPDVKVLKDAGAELVRDTCTYYGTIVRPEDGIVVTGSTKWAFYGAANLGCKTILGSWTECLETCFSGEYNSDRGFWGD